MKLTVWLPTNHRLFSIFIAFLVTSSEFLTAHGKVLPLPWASPSRSLSTAAIGRQGNPFLFLIQMMMMARVAKQRELLGNSANNPFYVRRTTAPTTTTPTPWYRMRTTPGPSFWNPQPPPIKVMFRISCGNREFVTYYSPECCGERAIDAKTQRCDHNEGSQIRQFVTGDVINYFVHRPANPSYRVRNIVTTTTTTAAPTPPNPPQERSVVMYCDRHPYRIPVSAQHRYGCCGPNILYYSIQTCNPVTFQVTPEIRPASSPPKKPIRVPLSLVCSGEVNYYTRQANFSPLCCGTKLYNANSYKCRNGQAFFYRTNR